MSTKADQVQFISLWRFEDQPASSAAPESIYLAGVESADVVLFIAGSDTSDATAAEVSKAVAMHKDILALILSERTRSERVIDLIGRIRTYATTNDVESSEKAFRKAVCDAVRGWLIGRIKGSPPPSRAARLETLERSSRLRIQRSWMAAGLSESMAAEFAADDRVGDPGGLVALSDTSTFQLLTGPKGSGKTLTLERIYQHALQEAARHVLAPVPVLVRTSDITSELVLRVREAISDFGALETNGVLLLLDGLDEVDEARSDRLIQDAWTIAHTFAHSRAILGGRNSAPSEFRANEVQQSELSVSMARDLLTRLGERHADQVLRAAGETVASTLLRPLFAIAFVTSGLTKAVDATEDVIAGALIQKGLSRTERQAVASDLLKTLAVRILDSDSAAVSENEFSDDEQAQLLNTRLVVSDDGVLRIPLRLITEYAASQWLLAYDRSELMQRISGDGRSNRWKSAITSYVRKLEDAEAESVVLDIARQDLGFAIDLAERDNGARREAWTAIGLSSAVVEAESIIAASMAKLYDQERARIDVEDAGGRLVIRRETRDESDRVLTETTYWSGIAQERHAALRFAKGVAVGLIDAVLGRRGLSLTNHAVNEEELWNQVRVLLGVGSLTQKSLSVRKALERLDGVPWRTFTTIADGARRYTIDVDIVHARLEELRAEGKVEYPPPFVVGDQEYTKWVWSAYSPNRLLERRRAVALNAMAVYREIVETWFPGLTKHLRRYLLMPAAYHEQITYDGVNQPVYAEYWEPLAAGSSNVVFIELGTPRDFFELAPVLRSLVDDRRPLVKERIIITTSTGLLRMWSPWPVRELAYKWIFDDLKAIGLTKNIALPGGDY